MRSLGRVSIIPAKPMVVQFISRKWLMIAASGRPAVPDV